MVDLNAFDVLSMVVIVAGIAASLRRDVPKAFALAATCLAVGVLDIVADLFGPRGTGPALAFQSDAFVHGQNLWTVVTAMFAHAGFTHLFGNLFILGTAGPALEDRVGGRRFLVIYFVAGLAATAAHLLLTYTTDLIGPQSFALGASGAIFGVLTAFAVRYPRERLPVILVFFVAMLPAFAVLLIYLGFNLLYMFGNGGVAWWGHFAGFLVGLAFAYTLPASRASAPTGSTRGLPDAEKLSPLASTPELRRIQDRIRQFTPETRTSDDASYVDAWLDKFFAKASCPTCQQPFRRKGLTATCASGETTIEFARAKGVK